MFVDIIVEVNVEVFLKSFNPINQPKGFACYKNKLNHIR